MKRTPTTPGTYAVHIGENDRTFKPLNASLGVLFITPDGRRYDVALAGNGLRVSAGRDVTVRPLSSNVVTVYDTINDHEPVGFVNGAGYVGVPLDKVSLADLHAECRRRGLPHEP